MASDTTLAPERPRVRPVRGRKVTVDDPACTLLRAADIVKMTKWSRSKVYSMISSQELPSVGKGRGVRVPLLGLREYIAAHTSSTTSAVV